MNLKQYLTVMFLGTLLCLVALYFVLVNVDPFQDAGLGLFFFYSGSFLFLLGIISIISFSLRRFLGNKEIPMFKLVKKSFTDAILLSLFLELILFLQGQQYLNIWNFAVLMMIAILFLLLKLTNKNKNNKLINDQTIK